MLQPTRVESQHDEMDHDGACGARQSVSLSEVQGAHDHEEMGPHDHAGTDVRMEIEVASPARGPLSDQGSEQPSPARDAGQQKIPAMFRKLTPSKRKQSPEVEDPSAKTARELDEQLNRRCAIAAPERRDEHTRHDNGQTVATKRDTLGSKIGELVARVREGRDASPAQQAALDVKYGPGIASVYHGRRGRLEDKEPEVDEEVPPPAPFVAPTITMDEYIQQYRDIENESLPDISS